METVDNTQAVPAESAPAIETPADTAAPVVDGDSATPESDAPKPTEDKGPAPTAAEKRIKQLHAQREAERLARIEAEKQAAYYRGLAESGKAPAAQVTRDPNAPPRQEDYTSYDDFVVARAVYEITQKTARENAAQRELEAESRMQSDIERARAKYEDFDAKAIYNPTLQITRPMYDAIRESTAPAEIGYYLGNNPAEAARIAALTPLAAAREIGRIDAKLNDTKPAGEVKRISQAPEPIKSLTGSGSFVAKSYDEMSMGEYAAKRRADMEKAG